MKEQKLCKCGTEMNKVVGTVTHIIFSREINLHNVPHFECGNCGRTTYDSVEDKVVKMLREAYVQKTTDVEFQ